MFHDNMSIMYKIWFCCMYIFCPDDNLQVQSDSMIHLHTQPNRYICAMDNHDITNRLMLFKQLISSEQIQKLAMQIGLAKARMPHCTHSYRIIETLLNNNGERDISDRFLRDHFHPIYLRTLFPTEIFSKLIKNMSLNQMTAHVCAFLMDRQVYEQIDFYIKMDITEMLRQNASECSVTQENNRTSSTEQENNNINNVKDRSHSESANRTQSDSVTHIEEIQCIEMQSTSVDSMQSTKQTAMNDCTDIYKQYISKIISDSTLRECLNYMLYLRPNDALLDTVHWRNLIDYENIQILFNQFREVIGIVRTIILELNCDIALKSLFFRKFMSQLQIIAVMHWHTAELFDIHNMNTKNPNPVQIMPHYIEKIISLPRQVFSEMI